MLERLVECKGSQCGMVHRQAVVCVFVFEVHYLVSLTFHFPLLRYEH